MQKRDNTGLPPTACNSLKIVFKVPKNDVTVAVNQCWRLHQDLKRAFRSILQVTRATGALLQAAAAGSIAFFTAALRRDF